jgi:hypothetical protein
MRGALRYNRSMEVQKWQYFREEVATLRDPDEKLSYQGSLGWELTTIVHATEISKEDEGNILSPEVWILVFKQPLG